MKTGDIVGLVIVIGLLIGVLTFASRMVKQYTNPLNRIADALEDLRDLLRNRPPEE